MRQKTDMLRHSSTLGLLAFLLLAAGCDAGTSRPQADRGDPSAEGSNEDLGADDLGPTPVEVNGHLKVVGSQLQNEAGEPIQLKGVSSMWLNWEDDGYAENLTALRWMRNNWKLSVIRAAMGIDPPGAYLTNPERAKEQVYRIVDNAIEAGVYVIVDWHDHYAHEHQPDAEAYFAEVAAKYAGVPNVLYETFNEPKDIAWPALKLYHEAVVGVIREHDSGAPIILGTPNYSQEVDQAARDPLAGSNLLYTLHYYACSHSGSLRLKGDSATSLGVALFVTEFGATSADGGLDGKVCLEAAQDWDDWLNERKVSWVAWKLDNCPKDSSCLLAENAPLEGGWTSDYLHGHALFVRGRMQQ